MPFVVGRGKAMRSISLLALNRAVHTRATNWHSSMCLSAASLGSFNSTGVAVFHPLRAGLEALRHFYCLCIIWFLFHRLSIPPVYIMSIAVAFLSLCFVNFARCYSVYSQGCLQEQHVLISCSGFVSFIKSFLAHSSLALCSYF